jgi:molecular chaperone DnaJ
MRSGKQNNAYNQNSNPFNQNSNPFNQNNNPYNQNNNPYNGGRYYRNGGGRNCCDMCTGLICADCLCECCGGDLISCC